MRGMSRNPFWLPGDSQKKFRAGLLPFPKDQNSNGVIEWKSNLIIKKKLQYLNYTVASK